MKKAFTLLLILIGSVVYSQQPQRIIYEIDTTFTTESGFTVVKPIIMIGTQYIKDFPPSLAFDFETHSDTTSIKNGLKPFYLLSVNTNKAFKAHEFKVLTAQQQAWFCLPSGDFTNVFKQLISQELGVSEYKITWYLWP